MTTNRHSKKPRFVRLAMFSLSSFTAIATTSVSATTFNGVSAVPDYGKNDCVSFKQANDTNPLNFTFGYACVSDNTCEVFTHGCVDSYCNTPDYSKGTRTSLTSVPISTNINNIIMAATGRKLKDNSQWCLIQDGAGNHWALDKWRGTSQEQFNLKNQNETIVPCLKTDTFNSNSGCQAAGTQH
uniref:Secreted protein n=1 Tax=uncultured Thiotrichaceae bacterium TaxID=298394 RepID=A0A6S6TSK9_9GAMM|nr:MAG: Unknown protein [uncultured Thiotrichaceae bacterium]